MKGLLRSDSGSAPLPGEPLAERAERLRLRLFDIAIGFGFGGNLLAMIANEAVGVASLSSRLLGGVLALVILIGWRLRRRHGGVAVGWLLYGIVATTLVIWFDALYLSGDPSYVQLATVSCSVWLPLAGWIFFLSARIRRGLLEVGSMVALFALIGVPQALAPEPVVPARLLAIIATAHVGYLVVFYFSRRLFSLASDASSVAATMERLANSDALTGLPNRRSLMARLGVLLERQRRDAIPARLRRRGDPSGFGVLLADIDGFKKINDSYGHDVGDRILREVAERLQEPLRGDDRVGRWGGEEFLALVATDSAAEVDAIGRRFCASLAGATDPPVSICCGGAVHHPGDTLDALLKRADTALYAAKAAGPGTLRMAPAPGTKLPEGSG